MKDLNEELLKQQQLETWTEIQEDNIFEEKTKLADGEYEESFKTEETINAPEEVINAGFKEVQKQENMGELSGDAPQEVLYSKADKKLEKAPEPREPQQLPANLSEVMQRIEGWTGKLTKKSSLPVVNAIKSIGNAATDDEMGDQLALLTKAALDYLKLRSGHRFTKSGKQRQADVKALVAAISSYLPEARPEYAKKISEQLKGSAPSADDMPEHYKEFYKQSPAFLDKTEDLNEYLKNTYGKIEEGQSELKKYEKEPHAEVLLSNKTAQDYVDMFSSTYRETLTPEQRKEEKETEGSVLYLKNQNANLLKKAGLKEKDKLEDDLTEKKFMVLIDDYLKINTKGIDFSSDEAIVKNAARFEGMMQKHQRFVEALSRFRPAFDNLDSEAQSYVKRQMGAVNTIVSYYRVSKMIITDNLYSTHHNDELALGEKLDGDYAKVRLSTLMQMRMQLEEKLAESNPEGELVNERKEQKDTGTVSFKPVEKEDEFMKKAFDNYGTGYGFMEYNKSSPAPTTVNSIHYDKLKTIEQGTPEYNAIDKIHYHTVDGVTNGVELFRNPAMIANLHGAGGLAMTPQEIRDFINDLKTQKSENMTEEEALACRIRGLKKYRDLILDHANYMTEKYGSAFFHMKPEEAAAHANEIRQDLAVTTNICEGFNFIKKCPSLYENADILHEIEKAAIKMAAFSVGNYANASMRNVHDNNNIKGVGNLTGERAGIITASCASSSPDEVYNANAVLDALERHKGETNIKWEGEKTKEELEKAKELSALGEAAYLIKKIEATPPMTSKEKINVKFDQAKTLIGDAIKTMPSIIKMNINDVTENLKNWKTARMQYEVIKDSKELTKEEKEQFEKFTKTFDKIESYLDAYSKAIREPGFVKLALKGFGMPADGSLRLPFAESDVAAFGKVSAIKNEVNAANALSDLAKKWAECVGTDDAMLEEEKNRLFNNHEEDQKKTVEQRAKEAPLKWSEYNAYLSANMEAYGKENGIKQEGVTIRKLDVMITSANVLGNVPIDECRTLWKDLSKNYNSLKDDPKGLTQKAKAAEKIFDILMEMDFSKMKILDDDVMENPDILSLQTRFGMEVDDLCKDYKDIAASNKVKDLKYSDEMMDELEARYGALMEIQNFISARITNKGNPMSYTPEGKEILKLNATDLMAWLTTHKSASTELKAFANFQLTYQGSLHVYKDSATATAEGWLKKNREDVKKKKKQADA